MLNYLIWSSTLKDQWVKTLKLSALLPQHKAIKIWPPDERIHQWTCQYFVHRLSDQIILNTGGVSFISSTQLQHVCWSFNFCSKVNRVHATSFFPFTSPNLSTLKKLIETVLYVTCSFKTFVAHTVQQPLKQTAVGGAVWRINMAWTKLNSSLHAQICKIVLRRLLHGVICLEWGT